MFKGFYNLTSGMLTQQRNLNVVANNLTNISTSGFKSSRYISGTFDEVMYSRVGNKDKTYEEIGSQSYIRATSEVVTDYTQGALEPTGINLDFAILGEGFFGIRNDAGETVYTRSGSFSLDNEGYLCYSGFGRVLDRNNQEIYLGTDKIRGDAYGNIFREGEGDVILARLGVFTFDDTAELEYNEEGFFSGAEGQAVATPKIFWGYLERSNVDMVSQMTEMLSSQRAFQSAAQVSRIYDNLMNKAANDIGRL